MNKYYLAHPFNSRKYIRKWQLEFEKRTGFKFWNPFYPKRKWENYTTKDTSTEEYYKRIKDVNGLVEDDLRFMGKCPGVVAIIDGALSYGTIQEIVWANIFKKIVYVISTNKQSLHPFLLYHATKTFDSFESFEEYINVK